MINKHNSLVFNFFYLIIFLVFLSSSNKGLSQRDSTNFRYEGVIEGGLVCLDETYGVKIGTSIFKNESTIKICESELPLLLEPVNYLTGGIASITDVRWENATAVSSITCSACAEVTLSNFEEDIAECKYAFKDNNGARKYVSLKIDKIMKPIKLDGNKSYNIGTYAYDANTYPNYSFYDKDYSWKFLEEGKSDKVRIAKKGTDFRDNGNNKLSYKVDGRNLEIKDLGNIVHPSPPTLNLTDCTGNHYLNVDIFPRKTINVNVVTLCENDDDKANYCIDKIKNEIPWEEGDVDGSLLPDCMTPIIDPNHICIDPGVDGTLDMYYRLKSYVSKNDEIIDKENNIYLPPHKRKIVAGADLHCDTKPHNHLNQGDEVCATMTAQDFDDIGVATNVFWETIALDFEFNWLGKYYGNYDVIFDDGKLSLFEAVSYYEIQNENVSYDIPTVFIVKEFENNSKGGLSVNSENVIFLNDKIKDYHLDYDFALPLSHEIGHAAFGWSHPDTDWEEKVNDMFNFMNHNIETYDADEKLQNKKIRKYQWHDVHN